MHETMVKTHLIITDVHDEYHIKWCGSMANTQPRIENGKPLFIIRGRSGAVEVNTTSMKELEKVARKMTEPKGRKAVTTDEVNICIKQIDGTEKVLGVLTHDHIKKFAPMFDKVYYR